MRKPYEIAVIAGAGIGSNTHRLPAPPGVQVSGHRGLGSGRIATAGLARRSTRLAQDYRYAVIQALKRQPFIIVREENHSGGKDLSLVRPWS